VADPRDPIQCNNEGLACFASGDPAAADALLKQAYANLPEESGILVNLGLALTQRGLIEQAERAYRLALHSDERLVRRSAAKNLGFLLLWRGDHQQGWYWHGKRFEGEGFEANQWRGDPLNGHTLTVWNDVGMGDAFQFVRYTLPLLQRGEKVRFGVAAAQISLFRDHLAWPLTDVVDRDSISHHEESGPHIPLMSLIALLDGSTLWGRRFSKPTWEQATSTDNLKEQVGFCWASNPQDRTMHVYKSSTPQRLLDVHKQHHAGGRPVSLQTDEAIAHAELGLTPAVPDWTTTLNSIGACKAVISVDTAVAHLAAGSGCPIHLLLGNRPDWRWRPVPEDPSAPLWYPNVTVESLLQE
jgi:hypothetical protein